MQHLCLAHFTSSPLAHWSVQPQEHHLDWLWLPVLHSESPLACKASPAVGPRHSWCQGLVEPKRLKDSPCATAPTASAKGQGRCLCSFPSKRNKLKMNFKEKNIVFPVPPRNCLHEGHIQLAQSLQLEKSWRSQQMEPSEDTSNLDHSMTLNPTFRVVFPQLHSNSQEDTRSSSNGHTRGHQSHPLGQLSTTEKRSQLLTSGHFFIIIHSDFALSL